MVGGRGGGGEDGVASVCDSGTRGLAQFSLLGSPCIVALGIPELPGEIGELLAAIGSAALSTVLS